MTVSERQKLARERNRRARKAVDILGKFVSYDPVTLHQLTEAELISAIRYVTQYAITGTLDKMCQKLSINHEIATLGLSL